MRRRRVIPDIVILPDGYLFAVAALFLAGLSLTVAGLIRAFSNGDRSFVAFIWGAAAGTGPMALFGWLLPGALPPTREVAILLIVLPAIAAAVSARFPFASNTPRPPRERK
jgi:hypothetical protein